MCTCSVYQPHKVFNQSQFTTENSEAQQVRNVSEASGKIMKGEAIICSLLKTVILEDRDAAICGSECLRKHLANVEVLRGLSY